MCVFEAHCCLRWFCQYDSKDGLQHHWRRYCILRDAYVHICTWLFSQMSFSPLRSEFGPDGIHVQELKSLPKDGVSDAASLLETILHNSTFPSTWEAVHFALIPPKTGKDSIEGPAPFGHCPGCLSHHGYSSLEACCALCLECQRCLCRWYPWEKDPMGIIEIVMALSA